MTAALEQWKADTLADLRVIDEELDRVSHMPVDWVDRPERGEPYKTMLWRQRERLVRTLVEITERERAEHPCDECAGATWHRRPGELDERGEPCSRCGGTGIDRRPEALA